MSNQLKEVLKWAAENAHTISSNYGVVQHVVYLDELQEYLDEQIERSAGEAERTGEITAEWLMQQHPQLSPEQAEQYRLFCAGRTIRHRNCYGHGQIMWPKWQAHLAENAPRT